MEENKKELGENEVSPEMKEYIEDLNKAKKAGKLVYDPTTDRHVIIP